PVPVRRWPRAPHRGVTRARVVPRRRQVPFCTLAPGRVTAVAPLPRVAAPPRCWPGRAWEVAAHSAAAGAPGRALLSGSAPAVPRATRPWTRRVVAHLGALVAWHRGSSSRPSPHRNGGLPDPRPRGARTRAAPAAAPPRSAPRRAERAPA